MHAVALPELIEPLGGAVVSGELGGDRLLPEGRRVVVELRAERIGEAGQDEGAHVPCVHRAAEFTGDRRDPVLDAGDAVAGELGAGDAQGAHEHLDVEVGEHAGVEQQAAVLVEVQPEPGDLAAADLEVVLAAEGGLDPEPLQARDHPVGALPQDVAGGALHGRAGRHRDAELSGPHDDRAAAGEATPHLDPHVVTRVAVDLGAETLVTTDERAVRAVAVQAHDRPGLRPAAAVESVQQGLVEREAVGGPGPVVLEQTPGAHASAHVIEQQYSWKDGSSPHSRA